MGHRNSKPNPPSRGLCPLDIRRVAGYYVSMKTVYNTYILPFEGDSEGISSDAIVLKSTTRDEIVQNLRDLAEYRGDEPSSLDGTEILEYPDNDLVNSVPTKLIVRAGDITLEEVSE